MHACHLTNADRAVLISIVSITAATALVTPVSLAATWVVDPTGGSHATTVAGGLALASAGDTVLVRAGTYFEHLEMRAGVVLRSSAGPDATVLHGSDSGVVLTCSDLGLDTVIEGFTITHGWSAGNGAGIACLANASPTILGNHLVANVAWIGSAIGCASGSSPVIDGNVIRDNIADYGPGGIQGWDHCNVVVRNNEIRHNRGGMSFGNDCAPSITGNLIIDNYTGEGDGGAGIWLGWQSASTTEIRNNVFIRNHAMQIGGAIYGGEAGTVLVDHNTFYQNTSLHGGDAIFFYSNVIASVDHNIIAGSSAIWTAVVATGYADCNDLWSNPGGDYRGTLPGPRDLHADPQFCDPLTDDYTLSAGSPCVAAPSCGLLGALGVGCGATATEPVTWGRTKMLFR